MVVGNGLLASAFDEYRNNNACLIFASGVSNSRETDDQQFERERKLIMESMELHKDATFIYFSTYSILDPSLADGKYIKHKIQMENLIKNNRDSYIIFRLSNIVGVGGNRTNIFNFLVEEIKSQGSFDVWKNATRNLLDIDHAKTLVQWAIDSGVTNETLNITNKITYTVLDIVRQVESYYDTQAKYNLVDKGTRFEVDISRIEPAFNELVENEYDGDYIHYLLSKYH